MRSEVISVGEGMQDFGVYFTSRDRDLINGVGEVLGILR